MGDGLCGMTQESLPKAQYDLSSEPRGTAMAWFDKDQCWNETDPETAFIQDSEKTNSPFVFCSGQLV